MERQAANNHCAQIRTRSGFFLRSPECLGRGGYVYTTIIPMPGPSEPQSQWDPKQVLVPRRPRPVTRDVVLQWGHLSGPCGGDRDTPPAAAAYGLIGGTTEAL